MIIELIGILRDEDFEARKILAEVAQLPDAESMFLCVHKRRKEVCLEIEPFTKYGQKLNALIDKFEGLRKNIVTQLVKLLTTIDLLRHIPAILTEEQQYLLAHYYLPLDNFMEGLLKQHLLLIETDLKLTSFIGLKKYCRELLRIPTSQANKGLKEIVDEIAVLENFMVFNVLGEGLPTRAELPIKSKATFAGQSDNTIKHYVNTSNNPLGTEGAWADLMFAIKYAKKNIFFCGWQFEPQLYIPSYEGSRNFSKDGLSRTLGEILVQKAIDNPELLIVIMPWRQSEFIKCDNHKNAASYLSDSYAKLSGGKQRSIFHKFASDAVRVASPMGKLSSVINQVKLPPCFFYRDLDCDLLSSRHLKMVIVDTLPEHNTDNIARMVAFYGSADLANGRFDWPEHIIARKDSEKSAALDHMIKSGSYYGYDGEPRRGWREVVSRAKGPIVANMVAEFVSRFLAGTTNSQTDKDADIALTKFYNKIDMDLFKPFVPEETNAKEPIFNCQLLRSSPVQQQIPNFWQVNNKRRENSIQHGYLKAIADAKNFIFIENQFLSSCIADCYEKLDETSSLDLLKKGNPFRKKIKNRIPMALVSKIIERHKAGEPFHVFIVLPMLPDVGRLSDFAMRQVRVFQWLTMAWMIKTIESVTPNWQQYLSFYYYGQWHGHDYAVYRHKYNSVEPRGVLATEAGRGDIYVHSKLMIVDDRVIINGSANMNERSMSGSMDGEIAIMNWEQRGYEQECRAHIRNFRKELWSHYMGKACIASLGAEGFEQPHLLTHLNTIVATGLNNMHLFYNSTSSSTRETGNLIMFPIRGVAKNWDPILDPDFSHLPDTPKDIMYAYRKKNYEFAVLGDHALLPSPSEMLKGIASSAASLSRTITKTSVFA